MDRQYVGIDFHRRRSVIVRVSAAGEKPSTTRVANEPLAIAAAVTEAGPNPEVVVEAIYGWYWVVDLLQASGARVHLANPHGLNWGQRRVKNDERDAVDLDDMLRFGRLPEAWIAPPATGTHHARQPHRRRDASTAEPRCHPQIVRTTVRHPNPNSNPSAAPTVSA
jgi:hypothetical protein